MRQPDPAATSSAAQLHVFCGPTITATEVETIAPTAQVHPPIKHGDLYRAGLEAGDRVLIIDGLFHQSAPIRHKEILDLIAHDVRMIGASSMGALRAAELDTHGMRGSGRVYELFRDNIIDCDDEVVVAHLTEDEAYRAISEPLVNFRLALQDAMAAGIVDEATARSVLETARTIPYTSRTWKTVHRTLVTGTHTHLATNLSAVMSWLRENPACANAKRTDAITALTQLAAHDVPWSNQQHWQARPWTTHFVLKWRNQFQPVDAVDQPVARQTVLEFCQLYDPEMPKRWRRYMLAHIAGLTHDIPASEESLTEQCDAAIRRVGLALADLTPHQRNQWLTPEEQTHLDAANQLRTLVARSTAITPAHLDYTRPLESHLLVHTSSRAAQADRAMRIAHDRIPVGRSPANLAPHRLAEHLDTEWALTTADQPDRDAAARDRGFQSFAEAVDASRRFFLSRISFAGDTDTAAAASPTPRTTEP